MNSRPAVWAGGLRFDHVHDYSYDGIMRSYEQSQMRLGMNRIDLLIIHDLDFWFHTTEQKVAAHLGQLFTSGWRALEQLRSHGLMRGIGAGINELGMMPRFLDVIGLDFFLVALRYTLMEQEVSRGGVPILRAHGRRRRGWRRLQFRHHRDGAGQRREIQLCRRDAGDDWRRSPDRGDLQGARNAAGGGGAAISALPIRSSPQSSPAPSAQSRCGRTSRTSGARSRPPCGRT